jgi:hypothetical protein
MVEDIKHKIERGHAVSGDELLGAIEQAYGFRSEDRFRDVARKFLVPEVRRRGRPTGYRAREDFALAEVDARYPALLRQHQYDAQLRRDRAAAEGTVLADAEPTPSELTYIEILRDMQEDFRNIDWRALQNKHSEWKNGRFHPKENDVDSEDFEAEIERLFPSPQGRS